MRSDSELQLADRINVRFLSFPCILACRLFTSVVSLLNNSVYTVQIQLMHARRLFTRATRWKWKEWKKETSRYWLDAYLVDFFGSENKMLSSIAFIAKTIANCLDFIKLLFSILSHADRWPPRCQNERMYNRTAERTFIVRQYPMEWRIELKS